MQLSYGSEEYLTRRNKPLQLFLEGSSVILDATESIDDLPVSVIDDFELSGLFLSTEKYPSSAEKYFDIAANALLWKEFNDFFPQGAFAADPTDWTIHIAIHLI